MACIFWFPLHFSNNLYQSISEFFCPCEFDRLYLCLAFHKIFVFDIWYIRLIPFVWIFFHCRRNVTRKTELFCWSLNYSYASLLYTNRDKFVSTMYILLRKMYDIWNEIWIVISRVLDYFFLFFDSKQHHLF